MIEKIRELTRKKQDAIIKLVEPARAAANQMKDAGMHRGADPVMQILFEIDAADQELIELFKDNPKESFNAILEMMGKPPDA